MLAQLERNITLLRDAIITLTAVARARGLGGHTGGPYDIVPEVLIVDALRDGGAAIHPEFFDEAGHRAALQYARGALRGGLLPEQLLHYREYDSGLAGHPEKELLDCIDFSSGRLGHAAAPNMSLTENAVLESYARAPASSPSSITRVPSLFEYSPT